jgi:hypothetical protein
VSHSRAFRQGDRIIYTGQYIGTLLERSSGTAEHWTVCWEDGGGTPGTIYPAADMVYANGGPASAQAGHRTGLSHAEAQELHGILGGILQEIEDGGHYDLISTYKEQLTRARELAALAVSDTDQPQPAAVQAATIDQLRQVNRARQERIWELEDQVRTLRRVSPLKDPMQIWDMFRREHAERMRLLRANRALTRKILHRARTIGQLRQANRELLAQITGSSNRLPG